MIITNDNKTRKWGLDARKRIRRNVYMRDEANRLHHVRENKHADRKIALVGTASSASLAPFNDPSFEIWGVGGRQEWVTHADRWYEVHRLAGNSEDWVDNWRKQAKSFGNKTKIYMHYPEEGFGNIIQYPAEHIMQRFGTHFLTSSFSWMMAHAIDELRPESGDSVSGEIGIWGVDMEAGAEYRSQRAGFHHFMELARFLNIGIVRLASSGLSYEPIPYPMWQDDPLLNKLDKRQSYAKERLMELDRGIPITRNMIAQNLAIEQELHLMDSEEYDRSKRLKELEKETASLSDTLKTMQEDLIHWDAVEDEQQFLREYLT